MAHQGVRHDVQILAAPERARKEKAEAVNFVSEFLLEDCFWKHLDQAKVAEASPLMTGVFEGLPLSEVIRTRFSLSAEAAEFEIQAARREVEL